MKKDIPHTVNCRKLVAILISKYKTKDKQGHFMMTEGSIPLRKHKKILNIYKLKTEL